MMLLLTILWFLLLLSFLVIIHELGHFLAAKSVGVHVIEFGVGYPPVAKKLFTWMQTKFTLNWLPLGGFVRLYGDDAGEEFGTEDELPAGVTEANKFHTKSISDRLRIILAGVLVNFVFGVIVFAGLYSVYGIPEQLGYVRVDQVLENSPAQEAGLQVGDAIVHVIDQDGVQTKVTERDPFINLMKAKSGQPVRLFIRRGGQEMEITAQLRPADRPADQGALGVAPSDIEFRFYPWWQQPFRGAWAGLKDSLYFGKLILQSLGGMLGKMVTKGEIPQDMAGPIGIVREANEADILSQGFVGTIRYAALLSLNLAIMNLLPIPALDGGRAVFVILEKFIGKARRIRWEQRANSYGIVFLLGVILLISIQDVVKIFR